MLVDVNIPTLTDDEIIEIFSWADPAYIPPEFIHLAKLVTPAGQVLYLDGYEYRDFVNSHPKGAFIGNVELALNLDRFSDEVKRQTEEILRKELPRNDNFSFNSGK